MYTKFFSGAGYVRMAARFIYNAFFLSVLDGVHVVCSVGRCLPRSSKSPLRRRFFLRAPFRRSGLICQSNGRAVISLMPFFCLFCGRALSRSVCFRFPAFDWRCFRLFLFITRYGNYKAGELRCHCVPLIALQLAVLRLKPRFIWCIARVCRQPFRQCGAEALTGN